MMKPSLRGTSIKKNFDILIDSLFYSLLMFHDFQRSTYISSLMHLVLVVCDASTVTALLCLKVNLCQIIKKPHSTCTLELEMDGKHIGIRFYVAAK